MKLLKPLSASDRKWLRRSQRILLTGLIIGLIGLLSSTVLASTLQNYPLSYEEGVGWTTPANILGAENDACAYPGASSDLIIVDNFNFTVPANSTIQGIYVQIRMTTTGGGADVTIYMGLEGQWIGSKYDAWTSSTYSCTSSGLTWENYGGPTDTWGPTTWTPSEVNDPEFEVKILRTYGNVYGIDAVKTTIYYTLSNATTTTTLSTTTTYPGIEVDLPGVPAGIGAALGISSEAGGMLLSFILLFMILVPLGMLTKNFWVILIAGLTFAGFLTAITWLPVWIMVMLCLITALMLGSRLTGLASRGGTDEGD